MSEQLNDLGWRLGHAATRLGSVAIPLGRRFRWALWPGVFLLTAAEQACFGLASLTERWS
jgi:hypothetical protein